ncbi:MAG: glycosyltransferase family 2 protein [Saprospiraceae bacterium]|nr:glycosyltransferase family 2 protein [Saprospiraceae bacterium]
MAPVKISAVIITFNEEENIARCLESLEDIADEILVVDSFSKDRTIEIAEALGARVLHHDFAGHIEQKNFALMQAKYDHVLSLDADEALSIELVKSIAKVKINWKTDAYRFNRLNSFCGRWIKHGLWYPDRKVRLWNRKIGQWGGRNPHDRVIVTPGTKIEDLPGEILHYTVQSIDQYIGQVNKFSSIQAKQLREEGFRPNYLHFLIKPAYKFFLAYFIRLGFLDGWRGFLIAKGQALGVYLRYVKIRQES